MTKFVTSFQKPKEIFVMFLLMLYRINPAQFPRRVTQLARTVFLEINKRENLSLGELNTPLVNSQNFVDIDNFRTSCDQLRKHFIKYIKLWVQNFTRYK